MIIVPEVLVSLPVFHLFRCNDRGSFCAVRTGPDDDDDLEQSVLNLDMDADVDHVDSYFARVPRHPPSSLAMHPIHADTQKDKVAGVAPPSSLSFVSHAPISPFHVRHPHLNRSTFARSPTNQMNDNHINRTGSGGYEDVAHDNGGCSFSVFGPLLKLRLHTVPSPDLEAPSPLELPPGTASVTGSAAAGGLRKIRMMTGGERCSVLMKVLSRLRCRGHDSVGCAHRVALWYVGCI